MQDHQSTLLPPTSGDLTPGTATPSGLTPNTRSEAEAALSHNALTQTESAAPTTPLAPGTGNIDGTYDSQSSYLHRRPIASSSDYERALEAARKQSTVSTISNESVGEGESITGRVTASPMAAVPFPPPGQGVVPLHTGVGTGQAEAVRRAKPTGMKLGELGRQPSFNEQDLKHLYSAAWMKPPEKEDKGYGSGTEHKGAGGN